MKGALPGPKVIPKATETTRAAAREGLLVSLLCGHEMRGWPRGSRSSPLPLGGWKPGRHGAQRPCPGSCLGSQASSAQGVRIWVCSVCERE